MPDEKKENVPVPAKTSPAAKSEPSREEKLARQLRQNLAMRKQQSRARNTKPRKFNKRPD